MKRLIHGALLLTAAASAQAELLEYKLTGEVPVLGAESVPKHFIRGAVVGGATLSAAPFTLSMIVDTDTTPYTYYDTILGQDVLYRGAVKDVTLTFGGNVFANGRAPVLAAGAVYPFNGDESHFDVINSHGVSNSLDLDVLKVVYGDGSGSSNPGRSRMFPVYQVPINQIIGGQLIEYGRYSLRSITLTYIGENDAWSSASIPTDADSFAEISKQFSYQVIFDCAIFGGGQAAGYQLVVQGNSGDKLSSFTITPLPAVPEPGTWALAVLGLASIGVRQVLKPKPASASSI